MKHVLPEVDGSSSYTSDIKKLISWYSLIRAQAPETLAESVEAKKEEEK